MAWYIPMYVSFDLQLKKNQKDDLNSLKVIIFIIYLLESIINLFTGYSNKGEVNMNKKEVVKNFFTKHFAFDVITLVCI